MESHVQQKRSIVGSVARGLVFTAITGALMAAIFTGVGAVVGGTGLAAIEWGAAMQSIGTVALSTGIFGGLIQGYTAFTHNRNASASTMRGGDVAITAASTNLIQPQLQQGVAVSPTLAAERASGHEHPVDDSTRWRSRVGQQASLQERLNNIMARDDTSHTDRLNEDRARAAQSGQQIA